ncbi:Alpha-lytic protease prodomain-containing protein [Micromonospora citrea]|uniref:Alpha-lytic protease prodomain-containing protein n=1 Tax=Micromonospora citrea TaxID=47855 RepID=A0A1C6U4S7_9ACTN|nr:S1 family peptidase [Micromonospora citrea]SCL49027.1 Alpha-lytic protease prodomain-containing protein [Micromonospora citrea]
MRRLSLALLLLAALLLGLPAPAHADRADPDRAAVALAAVRTAGTAWGLDPATGRMTLTVDDTVSARDVAALRATAERAGALLRREPGRLRVLIAAGQAVYGGGGRCSLGANVRSGTTAYFVTAGHCTAAASTWYADGAQTTVLGTLAGSSFPGNDYGLVRHTSRIAHPSAVYTHPGLLTVHGAGNAYIGQAVCRSGATTGVRCGSVTGLNATVNYAEGSVTGLIRTNICAEPGDSGGPLYVAATGTIIGILSGGSGNCTTGGTTYYQPITEILAAYGLTIP